eukprot:s24_g33.t1
MTPVEAGNVSALTFTAQVFFCSVSGWWANGRLMAAASAVAAVIGIRHYESHKPLPSCHKDAEVIATGLRSGQFPGEATWVYYDATRVTILQAINRLSEAVRSGARFTWFHYSGHGIWYQDDLHFVPSNSRYFEANVPFSSILESLTKHETQGCLHIMTLDCCQTLPERENVHNNSSSCDRGGGSRDKLFKKLYNFSQSASGHEVVVFCAGEKLCAVKDREDPTRSNPFSGHIAHFLHQKNCKLYDFIKKVNGLVQQETKSDQKPTVYHLSPESYDRIVTAATEADEIWCCDQIMQDLQRKGRAGQMHLALDYISRRLSSPRDSDRCLVVCDGTIGCGKTSFLNGLCRSQHWGQIRICREPVPKSAKKSWWPKLTKFYQAMSTTGLRQSPHEAVMELANAILEHHHDIATNRSTHIITERSFSSSVRVFCKALHDKGILPKSQLDKYIRDLEAMEVNPRHQPTLVLYFKMPVKEALLRIKKRAEEEGRFFEKGIDESYLKLLEAEYEALYKNREDVVVIEIDSTMSPDMIKKKVADQLHDNKARYCEVLKRKGYPEAQARKLLTLMRNFISN